MDREISRRYFDQFDLLASGGAPCLVVLDTDQLLAELGKEGWTGYGGTGDYAESNRRHVRSDGGWRPDS